MRLNWGKVLLPKANLEVRNKEYMRHLDKTIFACMRVYRWVLHKSVGFYTHTGTMMLMMAEWERGSLGHSWPTEVQTDKRKWHLIISSVDSRAGYAAWAQREMDSKKSSTCRWTQPPTKTLLYMTVFPKRQCVCVDVSMNVFVCACVYVCVYVCRQLVVLALEIVSRGGWGTVSSCEHLFLVETTELVLRKQRG